MYAIGIKVNIAVVAILGQFFFLSFFFSFMKIQGKEEKTFQFYKITAYAPGTQRERGRG